MTLDQLIITGAGFGLVCLIIWFFWMKQGLGSLAQNNGGIQEISIIVKGGYTPDTIVVKKDIPVRLNFNRQESSTCSDTVVFADFNKSAKLPEGETVTVEFTPGQSGDFEFTCQMGMLRGHLIVEDT